MEFLLVWVRTIGVSLGMDTILYFQINKDLADQGYLIDYKPSTRDDFNNNNKIVAYAKLIPFVNIFSSIAAGYEYVTNRNKAIHNPDIYPFIKKMTEEELVLYKKKPTAFNAIYLSYKSEAIIKDPINVFILDRQTSVRFKYIVDYPHVEITKINTNDNNLSNEEIINNLRDKLFEAIIADYSLFNDNDSAWTQYVHIRDIINIKNPTEEEQKAINHGIEMLKMLKDRLLEDIALNEVSKSYKKNDLYWKTKIIGYNRFREVCYGKERWINNRISH